MSAAESPAELLERIAREREDRPPEGPRHVPVAVTGGRDLKPSPEELRAFWRLWSRLGATELHHGDARGLDRAIRDEVRRLLPKVNIVAHPADWRNLGPSAGPRRSRTMMLLVSSLIAFPGGRGTLRCVEAAQSLRKPVLFIEDEVARMEREPEPRTVFAWDRGLSPAGDDVTAHEPLPGCVAEGLHPIASCPLWRRT